VWTRRCLTLGAALGAVCLSLQTLRLLHFSLTGTQNFYLSETDSLLLCLWQYKKNTNTNTTILIIAATNSVSLLIELLYNKFMITCIHSKLLFSYGESLQGREFLRVESA
jgi:hypothetical protein